MCNKSIAVVILHYNDFNMTRNYIENLKTLNWENIPHKFIIVDNASPDGSGSKLYDEYYLSEDVEVLLVEKNIGFARGNNVGILHAWKELGAELVVVSNNDIEIKTTTFPEQLIEMFEKEDFAVYGPDIYSQSKKLHQNPFREAPLNVLDVQRKIKKIDRVLPILKILDKLNIYNFLREIKSIFSRSKRTVGIYEERKLNYVLHGAFFVLSKNYFDKYPDGLYDGTFLYMEEDILAYRCMKSKLKMLYDPKISVIHFDGVSSLKESGDRCKKYIRELTETRKSCISYINHMRKLGDE
ncbi:glycosyltransferase [Streptococcus equinus]|uniref:glycosyltransferase n=1 Tax=Streptococcus equinus TaxID=1335 RepID=UPI00237B76E1|nr:glycosyltransferase [Streptococcus equinus]